MAITQIHHVDLAVADVERSVAFYLGLLGPLGAEEAFRYPTYRGTEDVVYLRLGRQYLGFRKADGGEHRYYGVGLEHLSIMVDARADVDDVYARCEALGATVHFPPEEDSDIPGYWAMFFFDPDGFRIEIQHWPGEAEYEFEPPPA